MKVGIGKVLKKEKPSIITRAQAQGSELNCTTNTPG